MWQDVHLIFKLHLDDISLVVYIDELACFRASLEKRAITG